MRFNFSAEDNWPVCWPIPSAFGPGRARWNLDASPFGYYLMTTETVSTKSADGRYKPETP